MRHQLIHHAQNSRRWAVVLDTDDEVMAGLLRFARGKALSARGFTATDALRHAVPGYYEWNKREYRPNGFDRQREGVSPLGDAALQGNASRIPMRAVPGDKDGPARGGYLLGEHVRPTLEVIQTEAPAHLHKEYDADAGVALIKLKQEAP